MLLDDSATPSRKSRDLHPREIRTTAPLLRLSRLLSAFIVVVELAMVVVSVVDAEVVSVVDAEVVAAVDVVVVVVVELSTGVARATIAVSWTMLAIVPEKLVPFIAV